MTSQDLAKVDEAEETKEVKALKSEVAALELKMRKSERPSAETLRKLL